MYGKPKEAPKMKTVEVKMAEKIYLRAPKTEHKDFLEGIVDSASGHAFSNPNQFLPGGNTPTTLKIEVVDKEKPQVPVKKKKYDKDDDEEIEDNDY